VIQKVKAKEKCRSNSWNKVAYFYTFWRQREW